ncbi:hypothetical protein Tsp_10700 [Trichinella spiralis]|uniref:hypothetical protein n=1 Tax=Trichinella spiralis TaxID=6334 RepID=UPI0001EFEE2D|nr:hypothetical protein Tsp_10700 [Trichinella spiralis]
MHTWIGRSRAIRTSRRIDCTLRHLHPEANGHRCSSTTATSEQISHETEWKFNRTYLTGQSCLLAEVGIVEQQRRQQTAALARTAPSLSRLVTTTGSAVGFPTQEKR